MGNPSAAGGASWPGKAALIISLALGLAVLNPGAPHGADAAGRSIALGVSTPNLPWNLQSLDSEEALTGKKNAIVNFFWSWDDANYSPDTTLFGRIADRGSIPMVTWMPQDYRLGLEQPNFSLSSILAGKHDVFIKNWAIAMAKYRKPVLMRFAHEMNGNWYPWSTGISGNTPAQYIATWRKIHDVFVANGATNVLWVWSPNVDNNDPGLYFPGDAYVDWVGLDGYNSASWGVWKSFQEVFGASYNRVAGLSSKPIMVAEVGTSEGSSLVAGDKAVWIRSAYTKDMPSAYPRIGAVLWFDVNMSAIEGPGREWQVDSSSASLSAYREVVSASTYQSSIKLR